jgi:hypothetical protein
MILCQVLYHVILDKANDRAVILRDSYSPSKEKRDLMLELEAIINGNNTKIIRQHANRINKCSHENKLAN